MIGKILAFVVCLLFSGAGQAQTDSSITARLHQPLRNLVLKDPVQAFNRATLLVQEGRQEEMPLKEAVGLLIQGNVKWMLGEYDQAQFLYFKALPLFEEAHDLYGLIATYNDVSVIYSLEKDYQKALKFLHQARQLNQNLNDPWLRSVLLSNLGDNYFKKGQLDSALYFSQEGLRVALTLADQNLRPFIYNNLGQISLEQGETGRAESYFQKALKDSRQSGDQAYKTDAMLSLGQLYARTGHGDRSKHYYRHTFLLAQRQGYKLSAYKASRQLQTIYEEEGNFDSAYHFSVLSHNLKDSLLNLERLALLNQYQQREEIRQAERKAQQQLELERQKQLLEVEIIVVSILLLSGLAFVFRRLRVQQRLFESWLLITLLILFETISLIIHAYAGKITHHSPLGMLLILVVVAALLSPLHHRAHQAIRGHRAFKHIRENKADSHS